MKQHSQKCVVFYTAVFSSYMQQTSLYCTVSLEDNFRYVYDRESYMFMLMTKISRRLYEWLTIHSCAIAYKYQYVALFRMKVFLQDEVAWSKVEMWTLWEWMCLIAFDDVWAITNMKFQSLKVVQPVAVIFKLFPADFWLFQEVWYQGHLPECACCVATRWERRLRGMLQIQLPTRLTVTVFIQLAKLVDVIPIFQGSYLPFPSPPTYFSHLPSLSSFLSNRWPSLPLYLLP